MDTPAAIAAFVNGEGGIYPTGTWMIGSFQKEAETPGRPLYKSYAVFPYPRLFGSHVEYVSGHSWVVPAHKRSAKQRDAIARFFKFMAAHNYDWARTGHIPAFKAVLERPTIHRSAAPRRHRAARRHWPPAAQLCPAPECDRGHRRRGNGRVEHRPEAGRPGPSRCRTPGQRPARPARLKPFNSAKINLDHCCPIASCRDSNGASYFRHKPL